ncbi:MAG: VWA domain-containing protein [Candidatus Dojkabacteria bacterium]|nr:VWA domain-containing protein [Candidatus Dojkabacteria bacterium]
MKNKIKSYSLFIPTFILVLILISSGLTGVFAQNQNSFGQNKKNEEQVYNGLTITQSVNQEVFETDIDNNSVTYSIDITNNNECVNNYDVVFVFDESDYMAKGGGDPLQPSTRSKESAKLFVDSFIRHDDHLALVGYGNRVKRHSPLPSDVTAIKQLIDKRDSNGGSNLYEALLLAQDELTSPRARASVEQIVFIVAGGNPTEPSNDLNENKTLASNVAYALKSTGVEVITIGTGLAEDTDTSFFTNLSSPGQFYWAPSDYQITQIYQNLASSLSGSSSATVAWDDVSSLLGVAELVSISGNGRLENGQVIWDLGDVECGASVQLSYTFDFNSNLSDEYIRKNIIKATNSTSEIYSSNELTITATSPWLEGSITDNTEKISKTTNLTYDVSVENIGKSTSRNVTASVSFPDYIEIISSDIEDAVINGNQISWSINELNKDEVINYKIETVANIANEVTSGQILAPLSLTNESQEFSTSDLTLIEKENTANYSLFAKCIEISGDKMDVYFGYNNRLNSTQTLTSSNIITGSGDNAEGNVPLELLAGVNDLDDPITLSKNDSLSWVAEINDYSKSVSINNTFDSCQSDDDQQDDEQDEDNNDDQQDDEQDEDNNDDQQDDEQDEDNNDDHQDDEQDEDNNDDQQDDEQDEDNNDDQQDDEQDEDNNDDQQDDEQDEDNNDDQQDDEQENESENEPNIIVQTPSLVLFPINVRVTSETPISNNQIVTDVEFVRNELINVSLENAVVESNCIDKSFELKNGLINSNTNILGVDYSIDGGNNWFPNADLKGLGTKNVEINFKTNRKEDKLYNITFRARTSNGSETSFSGLDFLHQCNGEKKILAHYFENGFTPAIINKEGELIINQSLPLILHVETLGGVENLELRLYNTSEIDNIDYKTVNLDFDFATELWSSKIDPKNFRDGYVYPVLVADNTIFKSLKKANIETSIIAEEEQADNNLNFEVYYFNEYEWEKLEYNEYNLDQNKKSSIRLTLFPGEYFVEVNENGSKKYSDKFILEKTSIVNIKNKKNLPSIFGFFQSLLTNLEIEIYSGDSYVSDDFSYNRETGKLAETYRTALNNVLFESADDEMILVSYWTRWDPYSTERLSLLGKIKNKINDESIGNREVVIFVDEKNFDELERSLDLLDLDLRVIQITNPEILNNLSRDPSSFSIYDNGLKSILVTNGYSNLENYSEELSNLNFIDL